MSLTRTRLVGTVVAALGLTVVAASAVVAPASAAPTVHKSYVCKYVGTPGVDERLQTGQNPIWVDNNALTGKLDSTVTVGQTFSDKHGKSVVIVANSAKLSPEPSVEQCPAPAGPTAPTEVTAVAPTVTAPTCLADGALVLPADTASVTYTSSPSGTGPGTYSITAAATAGHVLTGTSSWSLTVLPKLDGEQCSGIVAVVPEAPSVTAPTCEADGALVVPGDTAEVTYASTPSGTGPGSYTVTATATAGHEISGTSSWALTVLPRLTGDACATSTPDPGSTPTPTPKPKPSGDAPQNLPSTGGTTSTSTTTLAHTGAPTGLLAGLGAALLGVGVLTMVAGRRRPVLEGGTEI